MIDQVEFRGRPAEALREAREVMIALGNRAGDQWAQHRAAGIVRSGQIEATQIEVVKPDGTVVVTEVTGTVSLNNGADTLFKVAPGIINQLFPKPKRGSL